MRLFHYQITVHDPKKWQIRLPPLDETGNVLHRFAPLATLHPVRLINWDRSFALKGLRYEDYVHVDTFGAASRFQCRPAAPLHLPREITLRDDFFAKGPVCGDLIVSVREELHLTVKELGCLEGPIAGGDTESVLKGVFKENEWLCDEAKLHAIEPLLLPGLCGLFEAQFQRSWCQSTSLLRFSTH